MKGLTEKEARVRLVKFGANELKKRRQFLGIKIFLNQFKSPLIYILLFAGLVTLFLKDFTDTLVIFTAVFLNTVLGFYQEFRAQKSLAALKSLLSPKAKVIRDGEQKIIDAREIVPGDLVVLTIGDRVPADGVLVEGTDLTVNEAILTGESEAVKKIPNPKFQIPKRENLVYAGTTVVTGIGKMRVTKTGIETEVGKIGQVMEEIGEEKTPLQLQLGKLARVLAGVVGMITAAIFLIGELRGYEPLAMFTTSVAVAVAAIPEGLPVSLTVILALGMQRILRQKAIVKRLLAAETLGGVTTICVDKTGTLTEGKMRVVKADTSDEDLLLRAAVLCNDMRDPLEVAMMDYAKQKLGPQVVEQLRKDYPRLDEMPFSPQTKLIATLHKVNIPEVSTRGHTRCVLFVSGAPEIVLKNSKFPARLARAGGQIPNSKLKWLRKFEEYGKRGYRLVGFGYKKVKSQKSKVKSEDIKDLNWLGVLVYEDPVREGVKEALEECRQAGIKVKVITGDYLPTALAVLEKLGLDGGERALTGEELEKISSEELQKLVADIILFARTNPQQKLKIVKALKDRGEVVAMMGDGVNDAPALKQADIGIVVNEAADVARETADMVLLDSNFATIVHAVEEGRNIFENLKKVTLFLLASSFSEIILIGGAVLLGLPLPVTAAQILWVNLMEDSLPAAGLAFEPKQKELMGEKPKGKNVQILDRELRFLIFGVGIILNFFLLSLFYLLNQGFFHLPHLQTMMFVALGIDAVFIAFSCRNLRKTIFEYNPLANWVLNFALLGGLIFLLAGVYLPIFQKLLGTYPLAVEEWLFLLGLGIISLLSLEGGKWLYLKSAKIKK